MELREQFTLPTGASQSMTAFKSKPRADRGESPTSSVSGDTRNGNGMQGPITKVGVRQGVFCGHPEVVNEFVFYRHQSSLTQYINSYKLVLHKLTFNRVSMGKRSLINV